MYFGYQPLTGYVIYKYLFSALAFCFVDSFLCCADAFWFDVVPLVFVFVSLAWEDVSRKKLLRRMSMSLLPVFFQQFCDFRCYIQVFNSFLAYFCVWYKKVVQFHSSACSCLVFPALFIDETVFSPLYVVAPLSQIIGHISMTIFAWAYFWTFQSAPLI